MSATTKFKKQKNFRRRKQSSSSEDDETEAVRAKIEETKEAQKFRERQKGVSAVTLALGKKLSKEDEIVNNDPFKLKTGGLINMKDIKDRNRDRTDEGLNRDVSNMGSTFAAETNQRDEEAEMMKYIEERMMEENKAEEEEKTAEKYKSPEDKLYELPENLKIGSVQKSEEMLSNQMLSGIPEVDLGTEAKIKNIERTEEAKQKHIRESRQKQKNTTSFVPTNMAVNYVQHARYMHEELNPPRRKVVEEEAPKPRPVVVGDAENPNRSDANLPAPSKRKSQSEKATDDYHYERFRKQLRRY
ncbi:Telomere length and silencing protein 1-like [Holothuria leucospilota]|uniref:Telomere length and silencing protein 1-like n=1 Tax=Holothuria leucospilota TaxID=206669 RepID=A0A9Q1HAR6_HOLLE|nr:Telomere length and silencing protein 1-like [Holothuria leucospilota]